MRNGKPIVVSIGEVLWDVLPTGKVFGGAPANVVWHAAQLGADSRIVSAVGKDALGDELLAVLRKMTLDASLVAVLPDKPTSTVTATLGKDGIPSYVIHPDVAWDSIPVTEAALAVMRQADAVNFGTLAQRGDSGFKAMRRLLDATRPDCLRMFDVNLRPGALREETLRAGFERCTALKLNIEELEVIADVFGWPKQWESALDAIMKAYPNIAHVIVTRGGDGACWKTRDGFWEASGKVVRIADTIGAGDSLTATVIMGLLYNLPPKTILDAAIDVSAYVCTQTGATPILPPELREILLHRPYFQLPLQFDGERVWRAYQGGRELDKMHGAAEPADGCLPEEWILSAVRAVNAGREDVEEGLCRLRGSPERISLLQLIRAQPVEMLGAAHAAEYGASMGVLVKLIDSRSRLLVQVHPDKEAAKRLFDSRFGKTEAWHILALREDGEDPCLYMGFKPGITRAQWESAFEREDVEAMLGMLHRIEPRPGETYIVRGGQPHAIGGGCFIIEIQEPTDLTLNMQRTAPGGARLSDFAVHKGIGFKNMLDCVHYEGMSKAEALKAWLLPPRTIEETPEYTVETLVGYDATECFRMDRLTIRKHLPIPQQTVFSGLYVRKGNGGIDCAARRIPLKENDQVFLPAACEECRIVNEGAEAMEILRFYGPEIFTRGSV